MSNNSPQNGTEGKGCFRRMLVSFTVCATIILPIHLVIDIGDKLRNLGVLPQLKQSESTSPQPKQSENRPKIPDLIDIENVSTKSGDEVPRPIDIEIAKRRQELEKKRNLR